MKRQRLYLVLVVCAVIVGWAGGFSPVFAGDGESFKAKIQKKITTSQSNIQYEPYYMEQDDKEMLRQVADENSRLTEAETYGQQMSVPREALRNERAKVNAPASAPALAASREGFDRDAGLVAGSGGRGRAVRPIPNIVSRYAIYQAEYKAELEDNVVTVQGNVLFEVFAQGWTQFPLVSSSVGLIDVSVNNGKAFVVMQGNKYILMVDRPGRYNLKYEFLIKASRERENGPGNFSLEVMPAPISQFEFIIPDPKVDVFVEPAIRVEVERDAKRAVAWAVMPNTSVITTRWTQAIPKESIAPVKLDPKVYADTASYVTIGEGVIRSQTVINYSVLQSEVSNFRIALPKDVSVLDVQGQDLRDWKIQAVEDGQFLDVYLNFGVKGNYTLVLTYERTIADGSGVVEVPWAKTVGSERESGCFGIAASTNVELEASHLERATAIDVKELPSTLWSRSVNPILLAFKYSNHPFGIAINVTRHEEMPVLVAAIDSAEFFTLVTSEGKNLMRAVFHVRNNVKQFLRLELPKGAVLWSSFVSGRPVKPAKDKSGSLMIPLEKSQLSGADLTQFPVEIIYLKEGGKLGFAGRLRMSLPKIDIPINEIQWTTYLPSEFSYVRFGGDVRLLRGRGFSSPAQVIGTERKDESYARQQVLQSGMVQKAAYYSSDAVGRLEELGQKGALPIRITFPQRGVVYRFTKLLVSEKEGPVLTIDYLTGFFNRWLRRLVSLGLLVFLVWFIKFRKRAPVA